MIIVLASILGYPIYSLVRLSLQRYGLPELIRHKGTYIGLHNFSVVLHDQIFWHTLVRTIIFTIANVGLTIVLGMLLALLLARVAKPVRLLLTAGLVLVWSMPQVVAVQVWYWITNYENGVLNYILTELHFGDYYQHNWYGTTFSQLSIVTALIVWGALPFVAITLYAALSQVPHELVQAAEIDGARPWRVFRDVTLPIIAPVLLILTSLSILWDFGVFVQPYLLIGQPAIHPGNYLMGIYVFEQGYFDNNYGIGAAISLLMLVIVAGMSVFYVRKMVQDRRRRVRARRAQGIVWNSVGIVLFVILVFPVFWMISTAFKPDEEINSLTPTWFSGHPTLRHFRDAIDKPFFWVDLKNTLIIVGATVVIGIALAFLAAVALAKYRFTGRKLFIVLVIGIQMLPGVGLVIPLYVVLARYHQVDTLTGVIVTYLTARAAVLGLDAARLPDRDPEGPRRGGDGRRLDPARRLHPDPAAAGRAGPRRDERLRVHHELERVPLRPPPAERPGEADDHRVALLLPRHEPRHRLGRPDGRLHAHGDPGRHLLPDRAAEDRVRAHCRRGQGVVR